MAVFVIEIPVNSISTVITYFDKVKVYRSTTGLETDREFLDYVDLVAGQTFYLYYPTEGSSTYTAWYTYYNSTTLDESVFSTAVVYKEIAPGSSVDGSFTGDSYPDEIPTSYSEDEILRAIRLYIGDSKNIRRDYVNPNDETLYGGVSEDGCTYKLSEPPGWPRKVVLDDVEYTTLTNPEVRNYEFVTFSGVTISTTSGTLDIWYDNFRHSDREVLRAYYEVEYPPDITSSNVTAEIREVATSVALLETELRRLLGSVDGSFSVSGDTSFNPAPVLAARQEDLAKLRKKLKELVEEATEYGYYGITGVRIE